MPKTKKPYVLMFDFGSPDAIKSRSLSLVVLAQKGLSAPLVIDDVQQQCIISHGHVTFKIGKEDLGELLAIELTVEDPQDLALITHVKMISRQRAKHFQAYPLAPDATRVWLFNTKGWFANQLPEHALQVLTQDRQQRQQHFVSKANGTGFPGYGHFAERITEVPDWDSFAIRNRVLANVGLLKDLSAGVQDQELDKISDYQQVLYQRYGEKLPLSTRHWQSDDFFCYQYLCGCNAGFIEKCRHLPDGFNAFADLDNLYQADYALLADLKPGLPAPFVLFQQHPYEGFIVLAIQVDSHNNGLVYTPDDAPVDWLAAKMWARVADNNIFECCLHYLFAHVVQENFSMALQRSLPPLHPVYHLMLPFAKNCIAAAGLGKSVLFDEGEVGDRIMSVSGSIPALFQRCWSQWSLKQKLVLPYDLKQRQVEALPDYPYMEDGLLLWQAINNYITHALQEFYVDDEAVAEDTDIRRWLSDIHQLLPGNDLPTTVDNITQLAELLSGIIFNGSVMHSGMNAQMFNCLAFIPGSPHQLNGTMPTEKGQLDFATLISWLPDKLVSEMTVDSMAFLGNRHIPGVIETDETMLGQEELLTSHPKVRRHHQQFQRDLAQLNETIRQRNLTRKHPFSAFMPENITSSTAW